MNDDFDSKDIFLKKGNEIVGLHAIGYAEDNEMEVYELDGSITLYKTDFVELEKWGNCYDKNLNMVGLGSFRVHNLTIEHAATEFEKEGWTRFNPKNSLEKL